MPRKLPEFEGYTVDIRLKQFRKVKNQTIEFIDFKSEQGKELLGRYIDSLETWSEEFQNILRHL